MPKPAMLWTIETHAELASTQDAAIAAARAGRDRHVILARSQTAGRGRAGRAWTAPAGNLNFSAALRPPPQPLEPGLWSLRAGVALHDAITPHLADPATLRLKWPNDLLLNGAKLAGILVDSATTADGLIDWIVIGIGVNLAHAPEVPGRATTSLAQPGATLTPNPLTPETLAETLTATLDRWLARDFAAIRAAWLARAHPAGTPLRVQTANGLIQAAFSGLAEDGALLLEGGHRITSGDVLMGA